MCRSSLFDTLRYSAASVLVALSLTTGAQAQEARDDRGGDNVFDVGDPRAIARQLGVSGDDMRPDSQYETTLFGRPLVIGGEFEAAGQWRDNLDPPNEDGVIKLSPEAQLEFLYMPTDHLVAFAELKALIDSEIWSESGDEETDVALELREAWLLAPRLFGTNFTLQVGRQQYQDRREWWWDENLDSMRLHYASGRFSAYLGAAEAIARTSTLEDIDPQEDDVFRILGNAAFTWSKHDRFEAFFLSQRDQSGATSIGDLINEDDADELDADLTWFGVRARTRQKPGDIGKIFLSLDLAMVDGEEDVTEFDDATPGLVEAVDAFSQDVSGWGGEVSLSWEAPIELEPVLSVAYAYGSGDDTPGDGTDDAFRQSGLQGNNGKFRGVSRFRYYGETLRPELSNLAIATLALGSPAPGPAASEAWLEVVYHNYRQVEASTEFRTERLDVAPNGADTNLGDAIDVIYAFEMGQRWEFEASLGGFRYGDAFGVAEGDWASSFSFKLDYNF